MMFTDDELTQIRAETPACSHQVHFNNAGAALMPTRVFDSIQNHLNLERELGGYAAENMAAEKISNFYPALATLLKAHPTEIAFASNHTRAWEMGLRAIKWEEGDHLLIHDSAYTSNYLAFLHLVKHKGIILNRMPSDEDGLIDLDQVVPLITSRTKAIALTHMPTFDGRIQPAAELGKIAKDHNLLYLVDACQSVGQVKIDVEEIGCDLLAGTGRKWLRGPRGTGFLYARETVLSRLSPPLIDNISATQTSDTDYAWAAGAKRFETFERHVAGQIGLAEAAKYACDLGLPRIEARVRFLSAALRNRLSVLPVTLLDQGTNLSGIVTFRSETCSAKQIIDTLWKRRLAVSYISPHQVTERPDGVRASIHYYNTQDEIEIFCEALHEILKSNL